MGVGNMDSQPAHLSCFRRSHVSLISSITELRLVRFTKKEPKQRCDVNTGSPPSPHLPSAPTPSNPPNHLPAPPSLHPHPDQRYIEAIKE